MLSTAKTLVHFLPRAAFVAVLLGCIHRLEYVSSQDPPAEFAQVQPRLDAEDQRPPDGVYVNDSFEADELLKDAFENAARHDWDSALDKLDQVLHEHGHQVIASELNLYIGITDYVNRRIAEWPAEGLDAYRQRYEQTAGNIYRQAAEALDISALSHVYHSFFCTAAATRAATMLAEIHLEAGRFGEAKKIFLQLLDRHPDRATLDSEWRARIAICDALGGELEAARAWLKTPPLSADKQVVDWRGSRLPVSVILDMIATDAIEPRGTPAIREWPMFGGDATRTGAVRSSVSPTAPLWTFKGFTPSSLSGADGYFQSSSFRSAYNRGKFLVLQPVIADGMVFFKDSFQVWAVSLETGSLLWSYTGIAPAARAGGWGDRAVPSLHGCVAYGSRIYADLGHRPASYYGYQPPTTQSVLVCLDAATGRELWKARPQDYGEDPREVEFEGPAVTDESGVYIVARRRKAFGFEDCYLWKFDHSGVFLWRTHLASGPTGGFGYRKPTLTIPTMVDGTVYVQTNLGAIAAVQALSGQVEWISVYGAREQGQSGRWQNTVSDEVYAWHYNPIYPAPGNLLVSLPLDAEELLILDRSTGRIHGRVPRQELSQPHTLLGIVAGKLYALGEKLVCWDPRSKTTTWSSPLPATALYGRAALSASHIYVPCKDGLYTYALGKSEPSLKPWDHTQQGGNVIALEDCLLIAGNDRITLYGLREDVFARLQQRMDASPFDAGAALSMAEVAFRTAFSQSDPRDKHADYVRGEEALAEAIRRAGGFATAWDEQLKARVFRDCLEFARLHLKDTPADLESAIRLLVRAGLCPPDGESLLTQKSTLASAYAQKGDYPAEIKQYHQIISDRSLRELSWPAAFGIEDTRAIEFCRTKIAELIREHGRGIYKDIDDKASALLATGVRTKDLKRLDQIIIAMPNSLAAPKALLAKAAILLKQDQPLGAMRACYAALTRYPKSIDRAQTLMRIADSCLLANRRAAAWRWLTRASREFPDARMKVGADTISFLEYRNRLGDIEHLLRPTRPQIAGQLEPGYELELGRQGSLIYPEYREHQAADWSVMVISGDHEISAFDSASGRLLWPEARIVDRKPRLLAALKHVLIFADQFEVFGLKPLTGEMMWHYGDREPGFDDPEADPEHFPQWRLHRISDDFLVSSRSDGLIVRLNHSTGRISWQRQSEHVPSQAMGIGDSVTVFRTVSDGEQVFEVISSEDGSRQRTIRLARLPPVLRILPSLTGSFVLITAESLHAVDPLTGRLEWRIQFDQNFVVHSIQVGLDGIILSPDGLHVSKLSLDDGHQLWRSEALTLGPSNMRLYLEGEELYVVTERRLFSLDVVTGRVMGSSVLKPNMELRQLALTAQAVVLIGTTFAAEAALEPWILFAPRPAMMDQVFDDSKPQSLAELPGPIQFYLYDRAIISVSERGLSAWTSSSTTAK